jgi:hypothetical protein
VVEAHYLHGNAQQSATPELDHNWALDVMAHGLKLLHGHVAEVDLQ